MNSYTDLQIDQDTQEHVCAHVHARTYTYVYVYIHAHTHIHTPRHIWTHINTQIHRHIHTDVIMRTTTSLSQLKGFWFKIPMGSLLVCKCRIQEGGRHIHIRSNTNIHRRTLIFQGTSLNPRKGGWRCCSVVKDIYCSSRGVSSSDSSTHAGQLTTACYHQLTAICCSPLDFEAACMYISRYIYTYLRVWK